MGHSNEHLPDDVRDIAARLTEARATLSPLDLDDLRSRIRRRAARASVGRGASRLRRGTLVAMLAGALMLTSGAGVVIAAGYFGGGDRYVFQTTSFNHDHDASFCQYHGPITVTRTIPTPFGTFTVTVTYFCGRVIAVHISFVPPPHGGPYPSQPWKWCFGHGPQQSTNSYDVSTTAPVDTTSMTISLNGSTYTLPFDFSGPASQGTPPAPKPSFSVAFNANGGTGATATETDNAPTALTPDGFTRAGYTFAGWNTAASGGGTAYADGAIYPFTTSTTLYAQWKANPLFTVTFNANGGSGSTASETHSAPTALTPDGFTRAGYTFAGWNTAPNGSGTAYPNDATYAFTANATLYAQWTAVGNHGNPPPKHTP